MILVVDTNVLVSALLNPGRTPDLCLAAVRARSGVRVVVDARVEAEYREVLARPKFRKVEPARREALLGALLDAAHRVEGAAVSTLTLLDEGDRIFVDLCLAARADAVLTGNARHYPADLGFEVLSPAALLTRLGG